MPNIYYHIDKLTEQLQPIAEQTAAEAGNYEDDQQEHERVNAYVERMKDITAEKNDDDILTNTPAGDSLVDLWGVLDDLNLSLGGGGVKMSTLATIHELMVGLEDLLGEL